MRLWVQYTIVSKHLFYAIMARGEEREEESKKKNEMMNKEETIKSRSDQSNL